MDSTISSTRLRSSRGIQDGGASQATTVTVPPETPDTAKQTEQVIMSPMAKAAITRETEITSPIKTQPPASPTSPFSSFEDNNGSILSTPSSQSLGSPTLAAINEIHDLGPVMEYLDRLNNSVTDVNNSIAALRADMHQAQADQHDKIAILDEKMVAKHTELSDKLDTVDIKLDTYDATIASTKSLGETDQTELHKLAIIVHQQQTIITSLQATIEADRITSQKNYNELLVLTNSVEAHQRRWAVRIFGIDAPPDNTVEQTPRSKALVLDFIINHLKIDNITIDDIDTAHRVGRKDKDGKQTMLTIAVLSGPGPIDDKKEKIAQRIRLCTP